MRNKTEVIAKLILSTKRKNRNLDLIEIADNITWLKKHEGGLKNVANLLGISTGMLNQFLQVYDLPKKIQSLVRKRKIDSVSMVFNLSKFRESDQIILAEALMQKRLNSQDLKVLIPLRKQYPDESINDLIEKTMKSKNIKVSIIKIHSEDLCITTEMFKERIETVVGAENLISLNVNSDICEIRLSKDGERQLRKKAKLVDKTLKDLIITLTK